MKKLLVFLTSASLLLVSILPLNGQSSVKTARIGSKRALEEGTSRGGASFGSVSASFDGRGVLIRWVMLEETANAGFFVYKSDDGGRRLADEIMIPGSWASSRNDTVFGREYEFYDRHGSASARYEVEAVLIDGLRIISHSVTPSGSSRAAAKRGERNANVESKAPILPDDLQRTVSESTLPPNLAQHRNVVAQPGVKIGVRREGLYRVTRTQLQNAGFNVNSDSTNWRLFVEGNEQAIIVGPSDSYIEFYGRGIDTPESDTRVYYLISDTVQGKRIRTRNLSNHGGNVTSANYPFTNVRKERTSYVNTIFNGDEENYWGRIVTSTPTTYTFPLSGVDFTSPNATISVKMRGYSNTSHSVRLVLNGTEIGIITGTLQNEYSGTFTIPSSLLNNGNNNLQMNSLTSGDFSMFDTVTVRFARRYVADQGRIPFFTPGLRRVTVGNFSSSTLRIFDVTYDGEPMLIGGLDPVLENGSWSVTLPSGRSFVGFGVEDSGLLSPATITQNLPSTLSTPNNSANLVIISHSSADFMNAAETWANFRRNQGFTVKVIDVADVLDEFSYGSLAAKALQDFFLYADQNWLVKPSYALLIGDGSFDPRNYEGLGYWNMVPTKMVSTIYEETGSDEALADFNGDGLAELAIGRIASRNVAGVNTMFNKTVAFEVPAMQSLSRGAIFAYDLPSGYDFQAMSMVLRNQLPPETPSVMVDRGAPNAQTTLINEINQGRYIVNYSGHGSTGLWAATSFFSINNVPQLTNAASQSIFTMLTCLNGYFIQAANDSLAESLTKAGNGGAVAAWASSGKTTPDVQLVMGQRFFQQIGLGNIPRLGDLIRDAKLVVPGGSDVRFSWVLLGDPMLKVR
jgi:hypothetical protein